MVLAGIGFACTQSAQAQEKPRLVADAGRKPAGFQSRGLAFNIASTILNETRRINISLPGSFSQSAPDRRYPVVIVTDGESYLTTVEEVADHLVRHGQIPEAIVVAIENNDPYRGRVHDLTPPGLSVSGSGLNEGGDRFLDFIEQELLPAVDRQFRGAPPRVFIGHSSGGVLAVYAAATRPAYRAVIAIDAPLHLGENWLPKKLLVRAKSTPTPLRFAYYEARFPWPEKEWKTLVAAAPSSWKLHKELLRGEGHETVFMLGAYLGLREVFNDYSRFSAPVAPTTSILPYYKTVSTSLGATMVPPKRLVRDVVEDLLMEGRGTAAREAYGVLAAGFGPPEDSASLVEQIEEVERRPPPSETVEGLLATPFPSPDEARAYVGEWLGKTWMEPEAPRENNILRISITENRVVAELERVNAPPEVRFQRIEYLRITPSGLTFGFMNGMRPRGLILYEGTLKNGILAGKQRWGGINFQYPKGMTPPDPGFSFKRVVK